MRLFGSKKKDDRNNEKIMDDGIVNIKPYAPHQNLTPVPYKEPAVMARFKENFREQVTSFLAKTDPDQYNGSFTDDLVDRALEQSLSDLEMQHIDHEKSFEWFLASIWRGDRAYYEKLLSDLDKEYSERSEELKKYVAIYNKGTAFEDTNKEDRHE